MRSLSAVAALAALITIGSPSVLRADPSDRVARASYLTGQVWMRHGTEQEWMQFALNYPLTSGDQIWTDAGARSEIRIGGTALRLGELTGVNVDGIETDGVRLTLTQGALGLRVKSLDADDHLIVSTALGTVEMMRAGDYRIDTDSLGSELDITVRKGTVVVSGASGTFEVRAGQAARLTGDASASQDIHDAPGYDAFDEWGEERDRLEQSSPSAQYVSPNMTGYEDLDRYGQWQQSPDYGAVWIPAGVAPGWAPYRFGYWAWVNPWGWTWIDQAPWGFAPFHYGRWAYWGNRWVWVPGAYVARPVYAPALVAFVGGSGWSVTARFGSSGGVAWFPLAPGEPWVPAYHASREYVERVNVTTVNIKKVNVTEINVTDYHYRNRGVDGAVTAVSHDDFVGGRARHGPPIVVHETELRGATIVAHAPPVAPRYENEVTRGEVKPANWHPYRAPVPEQRPRTAPSEPVARTPTAPAPRPDQGAVQRQRELDARQAREHAQLQDQQEQERRAAQTEQEQQAMRQRQQQQTQEMESRHQQEQKAMPPRPTGPAAAPRQPEKPSHPVNVDKKPPEKNSKEKPAKPPRF